MSLELENQEIQKIKKAENEKVVDYFLDEINEQQDNMVHFFTIVFQISLILVPFQIIFSEDLKQYEYDYIQNLQNYFFAGGYFSQVFLIISKSLIEMSNLNFLCSFNVFIYFFVDTLVGFKINMMLGSCAYVVYILKLFIHDARPFWIDERIIGYRCKTSFGCPILSIFTGVFYFTFLIFSIHKRLNSSQITEKSTKFKIMTIMKSISIFFLIIDVLVGIVHIIYGENFFYQVFVSLLLVFILLRVIIVFDEGLVYYSDFSRKSKIISRTVAIHLFFYVIFLSILSLFLYSINIDDLVLPINWSENISRNCPEANVTEEFSIKATLLESCTIFQVLGSAFGLCLLVNNGRKNWFNTSFNNSLVRALIAFVINYIIFEIQNYAIFFVNTSTQYLFISLILFFLGFLSYGLLPLIFEKLGFNEEFEEVDQMVLHDNVVDKN